MSWRCLTARPPAAPANTRAAGPDLLKSPVQRRYLARRLLDRGRKACRRGPSHDRLVRRSVDVSCPMPRRSASAARPALDDDCRRQPLVLASLPGHGGGSGAADGNQPRRARDLGPPRKGSSEHGGIEAHQMIPIVGGTAGCCRSFGGRDGADRPARVTQCPVQSVSDVRVFGAPGSGSGATSRFAYGPSRPSDRRNNDDRITIPG